MNVENFNKIKQYYVSKEGYLKDVYKKFLIMKKKALEFYEGNKNIVLPRTFYLREVYNNKSISDITKVMDSEELLDSNAAVIMKAEELGLKIIEQKTEEYPNAYFKEIKIPGEMFYQDVLPQTLLPLKKRKVTREDLQLISDTVLDFFLIALQHDLDACVQLAAMPDEKINHFGFFELSKHTLERMDKLVELNKVASNLPNFDEKEFLILMHSRIQILTITLQKIVYRIEELIRFNRKQIQEVDIF